MRKFLTALALSAVVAGGLFGADLFVGSKTPILNKAGGKAIGELSAGAKLKQISAKGDWVQVEYKGFIPGESTIAYARVGVLEQDINVASIKTFKKVKSHKDAYDNVWDEVSVKGFVKKDALKGDINEIYKAGETLFQERCGGCHALHPYDEFNANVWPSVVDSMTSQAALDPNETSILIRFLQSKAPTE